MHVFYGPIRKIIPKLTQLPVLIWTTEMPYLVASDLNLHYLPRQILSQTLGVSNFYVLGHRDRDPSS